MLENCVCTFDSDAGVLVGKLCNAHQRIIDAKVASAISEGTRWREDATELLRDASLFMNTQLQPMEFNSLADRIDRFLEPPK